MNRKKGVSAVIATVLLILITIAAVTIIWAVVLPMIQNISDVSCIEAQQDLVVLDKGYTCYTKETIVNAGGDSITSGNVSVQIARGSKTYDLRDIQVSISSGGDSQPYQLLNNETTLIPDDQDLGLNLTHLPRQNNERVYVFKWDFANGNPDLVSVAPKVRVEGTSKDKVCEKSPEVRIQAC
jgi:flagellin-like protein